MNTQKGVTFVETAMVLIVLAIVAVVALPAFVSSPQESERKKAAVTNDAISKVKSAFAIAIAQKGDFPQLAEIIEYIDADRAVENNDMSGVTFYERGRKIVVTTYNDTQCSQKTNKNNPGHNDIVRCVQG